MTMMVDSKDWNAWLRGCPIQEAFPYLTPAEREFLKTGYTQEDWDTIFAGSED